MTDDRPGTRLSGEKSDVGDVLDLPAVEVSGRSIGSGRKVTTGRGRGMYR
jgi:hypothetical protein